MSERKVGRPSDYKPEYCQRLIEHMKVGGSFEAFAASIPCAIQTLYNWMEGYPEFLEARKEGMGALISFYENLGKTLATGQLRRIKIEKPLKDENGKPLLDGHGNVIYEREYESVQGNATAWIFMCKNMIGWKDKKEMEVSGKDGGPVSITAMTDEQLATRAKQLLIKGGALKEDE